MNDKHREAYKEEAREHLQALEEVLLELEQAPADADLVDSVFRTMHTIKGSGAMFGFDDIAAFTHRIETVFDFVRKGKLSVSKKLIDLTLQARDCIRMMLEEGERDNVFVEEVHSAFAQFNPEEGENAVLKAENANDAEGTGEDISFEEIEIEENQSESVSAKNKDRSVTYMIRFKPDKEVFLNGTNLIGIFRELKGLGDCNIVAYHDDVPFLEACDPRLCYTNWEIILTTDRGVDAVKDVFIFVEDGAEISIKVLDEGESGDEAYKKLGEILLERGDLTTEDLEKGLGKQKPLGEILIEEGAVSPEQIQSALAEQEQVRKRRTVQQKEEAISSIRVSSEKLDALVDLVGELVMVQARIAQMAAADEENAELVLVSEQVERLMEQLRDNTMSIRMLPIGTIFGKFKRLVRDLSAELEKEIELVTEGAETELDKTMLESLNDPLVHLIRNCIDHAIELPFYRELMGKPRKGTITLSAVHSGANVIISVKDDGQGLSKEKIYERAVESNLIPANHEISDEELYRLIFHPGFSTAEKVTNISGRGVGMDVVRRTIETLKGSIDISTEKEKGTTITITLPLTLAIIEGLLVTVGGNYFVLPLSVVEECVDLTAEDLKKSHGRDLAHIRGEMVPYIRLRKQFGIDGGPPEAEQIVVTNSNGNRVGFVVDDVIGQHQTVVKNLGKVYKDVKGLSGATILGDGTVALIIDVPKLVQNVEAEETGAS